MVVLRPFLWPPNGILAVSSDDEKGAEEKTKRNQ